MFVETSHGRLAYEEFGNGALPVLFLHGNSSSRRVFAQQVQESRFSQYRILTLDLPGHGESDDARDPYSSYTLPGFADATVQFLDAVGAKNPVVVGWSLGGHVAIELLAKHVPIRAIMLCGTPPVGKVNGVNDFAQGYRKNVGSSAPAGTSWSDFDARAFVSRVFAGTEAEWMVETAKRADEGFRARMFEASSEGMGANQREVIEKTSIQIAIINGADDSIVNLDYFDSIRYRNPWKRTPLRLEGAGHAAFWQTPPLFNMLLEDFLLEAVSAQ